MDKANAEGRSRLHLFLFLFPLIPAFFAGIGGFFRIFDLDHPNATLIESGTNDFVTAVMFFLLAYLAFFMVTILLFFMGMILKALIFPPPREGDTGN